MENKIIENYFKLNMKEREFVDWFKRLNEKETLEQIKVIAQNYGCGMSFIYGLLKKLDIASWKEFVVLFNANRKVKNSDDQQLDLFKNIFKITQTSNEANYHLLHNQKNKIINIVKEMLGTKKIIGIGFGHSFIALQEFETFYRYLNPSFKIYDSNNFYPGDNEEIIFIIFSMRSKNVKLNSTLQKIKQNQKAKVVLFTANTETKIAQEADEVVQIFNVMSLSSPYIDNSFISPSFTWIFVITILKSFFFDYARNNLLDNDDIQKEINSWEKNSYF